MNDTLNKIDTLSVALAGSVKDSIVKDAKRNLPAGVYPVSYTVRVEGTIKKGEDYDQAVVADANPWGLIAVLLNHLNGTTIDSIVREADAIADGTIETLKENVTNAIRTIKAGTVRRVSGKTVVSVTVTEVDA